MDTIKLSEVKSSNVQPISRERTYTGDKFNQLVTSYKEGRHIAPIRLRRTNGSYKCIYGHMRLKAMIQAGIEEVPADDPKVIVTEDITDESADLETILENHNRQDLKWWECGQQWRKYREIHGITQEKLSEMLPDVSLDVLKRIESGSRLADDPDLVIIITKVDLGYNSAQHIMRISGGVANWKRFLESVERYDLGVKGIDSYTKELARVDGEMLDGLLQRIYDDRLSVDDVKAIIDACESRDSVAEVEKPYSDMEEQKSDRREEAASGIYELARKYAGMLEDLTTSLPQICDQINEADGYREVANELYLATRRFVEKVREIYSLSNI